LVIAATVVERGGDVVEQGEQAGEGTFAVSAGKRRDWR
jgi:hypothetical protein